MNRYYFSIVYFNPYDIEKIENWLTDMSVKGYMLIKIISKIAIFKKTITKKIKYRLYLNKDNKNLKKLDFYTHNNWMFVTSFNDFYIFSNSDDNIVIDITDVEENNNNISEKLKENNKYYIITIIIMAMISSITFSYLILYNELKLFLILLFYYLPILFVFIDQILDNRAIQAELSNFKQYKIKTNWKSSYKKKRFISVLIVVFYVVYTLLVIIG